MTMSDNDLIRRGDALSFQDEIEPLMCKSPITGDVFSATKDADLVRYFNSIPAVDAVEVCRCGQCRFTQTDEMDDPAIYCEKWDRWEMPPDGFCSWGLRREEEHNAKAD